MNYVLVHCQPSMLNIIKDLGYKYTITEREIDVILPDIEYQFDMNYLQDPDKQFIDYYQLDWDQVNSIEAYNFCAI